MKKIEEAAADYVRSPDLDPFHSYADIFVAGARWFADQLKSNRAIDVGEGACDSVRRSDVVAILDAVRKEIEGE